MDDWFDVNDRLPKDRRQVLIAHKEGGVMQAEYHENERKKRFITPYGDETYDINDPYPQITHWMPLPISPRMRAHYIAEIEANRHKKGVDWFDSCRPDDRD